MATLPEPPNGYKQPRKYELPKWALPIGAIGLGILFFAVTVPLEVQYSIPQSPLSNVVAIVITISGSGYLHESAHYVVADNAGMEPEFVWPNRVKFGIDTLRTETTVASLLAPQVLSVLYVVFIYVGVVPVLEVILVWSFALNLIPGVYDICWAIRRLTWPRGTIVLLNEGESHVSFPEE